MKNKSKIIQRKGGSIVKKGCKPVKESISKETSEEQRRGKEVRKERGEAAWSRFITQPCSERQDGVGTRLRSTCVCVCVCVNVLTLCFIAVTSFTSFPLSVFGRATSNQSERRCKLLALPIACVGGSHLHTICCKYRPATMTNQNIYQNKNCERRNLTKLSEGHLSSTI